MQNKWNELIIRLRDLDSAVVAFSGGMDSTLVAKAAADVLGEKAMAVTFRGNIFPRKESQQAAAMAAQLDIKHIFVDAPVLEDPSFSGNPANRCYLCKKRMLGLLKEVAREAGFRHLLDGTNASDSGDYRPGAKAVREMGVLSPLKEAGLTKGEIRLLSHQFGLPQTPGNACLASRIPYGEEITAGKLTQVEKAEELLHSLGFTICRVRHHGETARIEVPEAYLKKILDSGNRQAILNRFIALGFTYVSLDLNGYVSGSLNKTLPGEGTVIE